MKAHHMNRTTRDLAVEQSLDAAIEIDEVIRGRRDDSPTLSKLVECLIGTNRDATSARRELLKDSQFSSLYHRAAMLADGVDTVGPEENILSLLFAVDKVGLSQFSPKQLSMVRGFCLGLNQELVSESFSRTPEPPLSRSRQQRLAVDGY